ncbi:MAG: hypothetical protein ACM3Q4_02100 [Acidobacteriota bacterium]
MKRITQMILVLTCCASLAAAQSAETDPVPGGGFRTADQNYFLVPSTQTLPAGGVSLSNIDVMVFNLDVGLGSTTQFSLYGTLPTTRWNDSFFMYGIKQNLWRGQSTSAAVLLLDSPTDRNVFGGAVFSYGDRTNISVGPVVAVDYAGNIEPTAVIGFKVDPAEHLAFMADAILPTGSVGLRWYGEHIALDLGGYFIIEAFGNSTVHDRTFMPFVKLQYLF